MGIILMYSQSTQLYQITLDHDLIALSPLHPVAFSWPSHINQTISANVLTFSNFFIDTDYCSSIISSSICLTSLLATRTPTHRTGLIQAINYQHSDGALHFYSLDIVSPDWLLTQNIHSRTFVNKSSLDIITAVLSAYDFEWQVSAALLASDYLQQTLSLRTQSDTSDWSFITSLLADIGVSTYWLSGQDTENLGCWLLVPSLDEQVTDNEVDGSISLDYIYAQASVQSGQDTVDELQMIAKQLGSRTVTVRADGLGTDTIYEGSADDESALCIDNTAVLIAAPSRVNSAIGATQLAKQCIAANACNRKYYQATGAMRSMRVGAQVTIRNLPNIGQLSSYCLSTHLIGIEPDSDSVSYQHQAMIQDWLARQPLAEDIPNHAYEIARQTGVWVSARLLESSIPYCPYPSDLAFASDSYQGLTQARTGTSGAPSYDSTVTDDSLQQTTTTPVWADIGSQGDDTTPPLRSLQLSSGATHGWQFAPRNGQPVLLTHWYGDIDSPVISRSLYDGIGMGDTDEADITIGSKELSHRHNTKGGSSPRWHGAGLSHSQIKEDDSHSGWISGIAQYGLTNSSEVSLLFDDSPNKVGLQWSMNTSTRADAMHSISTEQATFAPNQHILELGVLRHRYSNHQSSFSGHGFKVASDNSLQVMGNQGVLLSTFGIRHSQTEHESAWVNDAGQRQLGIGAELSAAFSEAKQAHLQSMQAIDKQIEAFKNTAQVMDETLNTEVLGAPDVLIVSKDSILASSSNTLWTATDIVRQSGSTQSDMVAGNYTLSADSIESLAGVGGQAGTSGLHMSANREPLAIQAQGGELRLNSQLGMTIGSEAGVVNISSPKRIKLQTSAGASITIDDSGVKLVAPGEIKIKAVKKALVSGARVNYSVPIMPETIPLFSNKLDVYDLFYQHNFEDIEFKILRPDGQLIEGVLDQHGRTAPVISDKEEEVEILVGFKDADWGIDFEPDEMETSNQYLEQDSHQEDNDE
jgi:type VI secretion system secreted protein VgrG